jgi:hypothetical protein
MRHFAACVLWTAALLAPLAGHGQEKTPPGKVGSEDRDAIVVKADFQEFDRILHKMVSSQLPRLYEDATSWGTTIPAPDFLRLPRLRTYVKVGDRVELPHGLWKKFRVWMDDPAKDLQIHVRDLKKVDGSTYRISIEADALIKGETDWQLWQKGITPGPVTADADVQINLILDCDVKVTLDTSKFPPEIALDPKIANSKLDLRDFRLKRVGEVIVLQGETARNLGNELKGVLGGLVSSYDGQVKDMLNQAIAKSLKEGKGNLSAGALLKALSGTMK